MKNNQKVRIYKVSPLNLLCPIKTKQSKYSIRHKPIQNNTQVNTFHNNRCSENGVQNSSFTQFQEQKKLHQRHEKDISMPDQVKKELQMLNSDINWNRRLEESSYKKQRVNKSKGQKNFRSTQYKNSQICFIPRNPQRTYSSMKYNADNIKQIGYKSPYIKSKQDLQKVMRLLRPVKGPAESLLKQIKKHNNQSQKTAERAFINRKQNFQKRMKQFISWMGIQDNKKIFIMNSQDTHIRSALISAGWVQNSDQSSNLFHLKWVYIDSPQDYQSLQQQQLYNHFRCNQQLTNKNNLRKNVKKAHRIMRPNIPPTYDLAITQQFSAFAQNYHVFDTFWIFGELVKIFKQQDPKRFQLTKKLYQNTHFYANKAKISKIQAIKNQLNILFKESSEIKDKTLQDLHDVACFACNYISENKSIQYSFFTYQKQQHSQKILKAIITIKQCLKHKQNRQDLQQKLKSKLTPFFKTEILKIHLHLQSLFGGSLGDQNIWISKPVGVSRGSGITIQNNFAKLMTLKYGKIVQKYIQKPYLFECQRKFDIRQWILVKSFSPLLVYSFEHCYSRFSYEAYDEKQQSLTNLNKHLTNYSKNRYKFQNKEDSVVSQEQLQSTFGHSEWQKIKQSMKLQIYKTLHCCAPYIYQRSSSFEIYGFDVMIDSNSTPWILQVNLSPACEKRSQFLAEYLQKMSNGIVAIIQGQQSKHWHHMHNQQNVVNCMIQHSKNIQKVLKIQSWWRSHRKQLKFDTNIQKLE